jgi:iron-sulfur cluster assembly accessory protein
MTLQKQIQKITKDTTIGEIVEKYPQVVDTLTSFGVHCVGCHVSPFESLEGGFKGHGMDDATINEAVIKLNQVIEDSPAKQDTISGSNIKDANIIVTDKAAEKIKSIILQENKAGLRMSVLPGGCSGFQYGMELEDSPNEDDITLDQKGIKLFIDKASLAKLNGANIDYIESLKQSGFKIDNPNATKTCGCGNSFG